MFLNHLRERHHLQYNQGWTSGGGTQLGSGLRDLQPGASDFFCQGSQRDNNSMRWPDVMMHIRSHRTGTRYQRKISTKLPGIKVVPAITYQLRSENIFKCLISLENTAEIQPIYKIYLKELKTDQESQITALCLSRTVSVSVNTNPSFEKNLKQFSSLVRFLFPPNILILPSRNVPPEFSTNPIIFGGRRVSVALLDHISITLIGADRPAEPGENQQRAEGLYTV